MRDTVDVVGVDEGEVEQNHLYETNMTSVSSQAMHTRHSLDGEWGLRFVREFDIGSVCLWIRSGGEGNRG